MAEQPWTIDATAAELVEALRKIEAMADSGVASPAMLNAIKRVARALLAKAVPL